MKAWNRDCLLRKNETALLTKPPNRSRWTRRPFCPRAVLQGIRLPGLLTSPTPVLDEEDAHKAAVLSVPPMTKRIFCSFFSSELGGIVREPSLMNVPVDDRMFLHGHGASEMLHMSQGYLYLFDDHIARFIWSISKAGMRLPCSEMELKRIVLHTAAAGNKLNGFVRIWLSGGRGSFGVSVRGGKGPALYVLTTCEKPYQDYDLEVGFKAKTSRIPIHDSYYTTLQSNGNLPAVLSQLEAEHEKCDLGILVDEDMNVISAGEYDIAMITQKNELVFPPYSEYLTGIEFNRLLELLSKSEDKYLKIDDVQSRLFSVLEAQQAKEVFVTHPTIPVMGVTQWDKIMIADGTSGMCTAAFSEMIVEDSEPRENSYVHTEIPYGYMTYDPEEV